MREKLCHERIGKALFYYRQLSIPTSMLRSNHVGLGLVMPQGLANYRIGSEYQKANDPSKALGFHAEYLQLCKMCGDKAGMYEEPV